MDKRNLMARRIDALIESMLNVYAFPSMEQVEYATTFLVFPPKAAALVSDWWTTL